MGAMFSKDEESDKVYDVKRIYWDADGNLRHGATANNRDEEIMDVLQVDRSLEDTSLCMIIPSRWVRKWLLYAHYKVCDAPGRIDMYPLLQQDDAVEGGWRPKNTLVAPSFTNDPNSEDHPGHYRRISLEAWLRFVDLYNVSGYAIAVHGAPFDDKSRWRVFKNPRLIDASKLPPPVVPEKTEPANAEVSNKKK